MGRGLGANGGSKVSGVGDNLGVLVMWFRFWGVGYNKARA